MAAILIILGSYIGRKNGSAIVLFFLVFFVVVVVPNMILFFTGREINEAIVIDLWATMFLSVLILGYSILWNINRKRRSIAHFKRRLILASASGRGRFTSVAAMVTSIILVLAHFEFNVFETKYNWSSVRSESSLLLLLVQYLVMISAPVLLLATEEKKISLYIVVVIYVSLHVIILQSRSGVVAQFAPVLGCFLLYSEKHISRRSIDIIKALFFGAGLIALYVYTRVIRLMSSWGDDTVQIGWFAESGSFEYLRSIIKEHTVYSSLVDLRSLVISFIPDFINPFDSVKDSSELLWDQSIGLINVGGSIHPTIVGSALLNGGAFGIVVFAILIAVIFYWLDRKASQFSSFSLIYYASACVVVFYLVRGAIVNGLSVLLVTHLLVLCVRAVDHLVLRKR